MQKRFNTIDSCIPKKEKIKVSVVMPAYNAQNYIVQAIDSVFQQTIKENIELLIVEDCSTDATVTVIKDYIRGHSKEEKRSIRLLSNAHNMGVAASRNRAVTQAKGEYIAFLDADDWWDETKLQKQLAICDIGESTASCPVREKSVLRAAQYEPVSCDKESRPVLCYSGRELMHPDGSTLGKIVEVPERVDYAMLLRTNHIPCSSVLLKTEVAREFRMCHDELHEDYIMWLQITKKYGEAVGINEPLLKSRLSEGGKSRNKWKSAKMQYGVYRYLGIHPVAAFFYMGCYMVNGIRKYS